MKKVVLTFGLIAGIVMAIMVVLSTPSMLEGDSSSSMLVGYTSMVIALSLIFFAVKIYRDKHNGGTVTFGKAFLIGIYISLIASAMYSLGFEIGLASNNMSGGEFMSLYAEGQVKAQLGEDVSAEVLQKEKGKIVADYGWYDNLVLRFLWTMIMEMFIVGVIVSLICAAILKKKPVQQSIA